MKFFMKFMKNLSSEQHFSGKTVVVLGQSFCGKFDKLAEMVIVHEEEAGSKEKLLSKDIRKGGILKAKKRKLAIWPRVHTQQ